jgi:ribonuclease HII
VNTRTSGNPPDLVLGIDEAGRGSWVGPLVVGGFLTDRITETKLRDLGVDDSKRLSPQRREEVYDLIGSVGHRFAVSLPPPVIDRFVRDGRLNELEARAFARLVRATHPTQVYVDACDPVAARFGDRVSSLSGVDSPVDARHRADQDVPVVAAASIVAKVCRDRAIDRLRARLGDGMGSGYPSDESTVIFVRSYFEGAREHPAWLRRSWAPTERLMQERTARRLESFA